MASGVDTLTHTWWHESDFKKPGARRPVPGIKITFVLFNLCISFGPVHKDQLSHIICFNDYHSLRQQ